MLWAHKCTFLYKATILNLVTMEGLSQGKFAEGVGVPPTLLPQTSNGQASKCNPRWWHQTPSLLSTLFQNLINNACTLEWLNSII